MENSTYLDHVIVRRRRKRFHELSYYIQTVTSFLSELFGGKRPIQPS